MNHPIDLRPQDTGASSNEDRAAAPSEPSPEEVSGKAGIPCAWRPLAEGYWTGEPNDNRLGHKVLLFKDGEIYSAKWVSSEVMGPVWATPDGHVIFRATHWMPQPSAPTVPA